MNRVNESDAISGDDQGRRDWQSDDDDDDQGREDWSAWGNQTLDEYKQADTNKDDETEVDIIFDADGLQKRYQYDGRLEAVSKALLDIELPGDFFVSGERTTFPLPGLFVQGIGSVPLPLIDSTASKLASLCGRRGDHSLEERTTWEIPGGQVELTNAAWNDFVASDIITASRGPLGLHSTLQVEAKFAKMVLCKAGGVIATSKDTDRATCVFATLLVVLPGRFAGGAMRVHAPVSDANAPVSGANSHVWDPSATSEYAIKYAAFYVDCPVEMEPVASGDLVFLVYNLVVVEPTASTPHYGDNQPLYDRLQATMSQFFAADAQVEQRKRQRVDEQGSRNPVGFDISNPATHRECQLVYTLRDKYTHKELSFATLETQDSIVARSLVRFCDESHGAFEVYLAKIQFRMLYPMGRVPDDSKIKASECGTVLLLGCPWVAPDGTTLGTARPDLPLHQWQLSVANLTTEVTPTSRFPSQNLDFDAADKIVYGRDTKLGTVQKLYTSAALVVVPLRVSARLQFTKDVTGTLTKWVARIDSNPSQAIAMVSSFTEKQQDWSIAGQDGVVAIDGVLDLGDLNVLAMILKSCPLIEFQPKLREILEQFKLAAIVSMVLELGELWESDGCPWFCYRARNSVNLVASLLNGCQDREVITCMMEMIDVTPYVYSDEDGYFDPMLEQPTWMTPDEYARIVQLALVLSVQLPLRLLHSVSLKTLGLVVGPATALLVRRTYPSVFSPRLYAVARFVVEQLKQKLPWIRNLSYPTTNVACNQYRTCPCQPLVAFLDSSAKEAIFDRSAFKTHMRLRLEYKELYKRIRVQYVGEDKVQVTKSFGNRAFQQAQRALDELHQLLS